MEFTIAKDVFINRLASYQFAPAFVQALSCFRPQFITPRPHEPRGPRLWFVIPFQPAVYKAGLGSLLMSLYRSWYEHLRPVLGPFAFGISWSLAFPRHSQIVQRHTYAT